jgi:type I restriction enzyme S subunit
MAGEWRQREVSALIDGGALLIGDGYRAKNEELSSSGLPFARAGNINNGFQFADADNFPEAGLPRVGNKVSQPGDVVFTSKGTVGRFAFVRPGTQQFVYSPQLCFWRPLNKALIDPRFLYFWMCGREFFVQFKGVAGQTDMAEYVSLSDQRRMHITLPPLVEQRAIARILGTLDDKIELNRRMNETLEAMARALFKSWFVDFDPVRAKMEVRDPCLPVVLADLFPSRFVDSTIGEIPEGWDVKLLPEVIDVNPIRPLRKGTEAPYLDMANMPTRGHSPDSLINRPFGSGMRFMNGDTLMARITPCLENGKTAFVDFLQDGQVGWGSTEYIVLRPRPPLPLEFAYCLARSDGFRDFAIQAMTGSSGRQRVPAESLAHFHVAVPPAATVEVFGRVVKPIFSRSAATARESRTLAALRDTLVPKLISGEVRVQAALECLEARVS